MKVEKNIPIGFVYLHEDQTLEDQTTRRNTTSNLLKNVLQWHGPIDKL